MVFDPASRKTVACQELVEAFARDPHPDGKTMQALADLLGLNKKQVSNFFERERRKAGVVIESRRKGTSAAGLGAAHAQSPSINSNSRSHSRSVSVVSDANTAATSVSSRNVSRLSVVNPADFATPARKTTRTRTRKPMALREDEENVSEEEDVPTEEGQNDDMFAEPTQARQAPAGTPLTAPRNASNSSAQRYTRGASSISLQRYAASPYRAISPRLAGVQTTPSALASRPMKRNISSTSSHSPAQSESAMTNASVDQPSFISEFGKSVKKHKNRASTPIDSPTVQFLKNPFPSPIPQLQLASPDAQSAHDTPLSGDAEQATDYFSLQPGHNYASAQQSIMQQKRPRNWFSKSEDDPASRITSSVLMQANLARQPSAGLRGFEKITHGVSAEHFTRSSAAALADNSAYNDHARAQSAEASDDEQDSDSEYGEDDKVGGSKQKRAAVDNRPGAALRTTIACTELRSAFLSNPHPPTGVLDELAARLGLGKKQVSNYFVRERKKAGYQIKVRHGMNQRRKGSGSKSKKAANKATPASASTKVDAVEEEHPEQTPVEEAMDVDDGEHDEEEEEEDEFLIMDDTSSIVSDLDASNASSHPPELGYYEEDPVEHTRKAYAGSPPFGAMSLLPAKGDIQHPGRGFLIA